MSDIREQIEDLSRRAVSDEDFEELCTLLVRAGFLRTSGIKFYKVRRQSDGQFWNGKGEWSTAGRTYSSWGRAKGYADQLRRGTLTSGSLYGWKRYAENEVYEAVEITPVITRSEPSVEPERKAAEKPPEGPQIGVVLNINRDFTVSSHTFSAAFDKSQED